MSERSLLRNPIKRLARGPKHKPGTNEPEYFDPTTYLSTEPVSFNPVEATPVDREGVARKMAAIALEREVPGSYRQNRQIAHDWTMQKAEAFAREQVQLKRREEISRAASRVTGVDEGSVPSQAAEHRTQLFDKQVASMASLLQEHPDHAPVLSGEVRSQTSGLGFPKRYNGYDVREHVIEPFDRAMLHEVRLEAATVGERDIHRTEAHLVFNGVAEIINAARDQLYQDGHKDYEDAQPPEEVPVDADYHPYPIPEADAIDDTYRRAGAFGVLGGRKRVKQTPPPSAGPTAPPASPPPPGALPPIHDPGTPIIDLR
jgi:hypothetical protein